MDWISGRLLYPSRVYAPVRVCLCECVWERHSKSERERPTLWADSMNIVVTATFFQLSTAAGPCDRKRHTGGWDGIHKGCLTGA